MEWQLSQSLPRPIWPSTPIRCGASSAGSAHFSIGRPTSSPVSSRRAGRTRRLTTTGGDVIVEKLLAFDDAARSYSYGVLESPFPVTSPTATLQVLPQADGPGTHVNWTGELIPKGISDAEATAQLKKIYDDGLASLLAHFASK